MPSIMGDYTHHSHAWDIQEAFQLGLIAFNTPFIGGPGKHGTGSRATSEGEITGMGLGSKLRIGSQTLTYDAGANRITIDKPARR